MGTLDEEAFEDLMAEEPDEMLALLATLTGATDRALRELARRLAGRLYLDLARTGPIRPRGVGRMIEQPFRLDGGDLDLDASLDAILAARSAGEAVDPERLRIRAWATPSTALCLLVDRSGSMGGAPLATAAVAAAAVAFRAPQDYSVLSFAKDVVAVTSQDRHREVAEVVDGVLALKGFGTTDLAGALMAAHLQLLRSRATRKITLLLSDCRATEPGDAARAARMLDELVILAPEGDSEDAERLAAEVGARVTTVAGPSEIPAALIRVLGN